MNQATRAIKVVKLIFREQILLGELPRAETRLTVYRSDPVWFRKVIRRHRVASCDFLTSTPIQKISVHFHSLWKIAQQLEEQNLVSESNSAALGS